MKRSTLIVVAASCGVLAAAGAGLASWAVVTAGQNGVTSAASELAGDDGVYVGDELNALLLTDEQVATLGIGATVDGASADYGTAPFEASPVCAAVIGQTPMNPAGVRTIEMGAQGSTLFRQHVVQFPTVEDAETAFALVTQGADECATFVDDLGQAWTWTTVTATDAPAVIGGYAGADGTTDRVIVVGQTANAVSYAYAATTASGLSPADLAAALATATGTQLAP